MFCFKSIVKKMLDTNYFYYKDKIFEKKKEE